jgi:hypothetical protein
LLCQIKKNHSITHHMQKMMKLSLQSRSDKEDAE